MRTVYACIFTVFIAALIVCAVKSRRSLNPIADSVRRLIIGVLIPVVGNYLLIVPGPKLVSDIGRYVYFIGMVICVYRVLRFTMDYCNIEWKNKLLKYTVWGFIAVDGIQLLLNIFTHHAFSVEKTMVDGYAYYLLVPHWGQSLHRVIVYGIFFASLGVIIVKLIMSPRIYKERYSTMTAAMVISCLVESYYIFSRKPIDLSMLAIAIYAFMVYYFALYYRPMRLLDRMLAGIASEMNESLFFYDLEGKCIWANEPAVRLTGVEQSRYEETTSKLFRIFGEDVTAVDDDSTHKKDITVEDEERYYTLERRVLYDDKDRLTGSFLRIRDDTDEQKRIRREFYNATHDRLTGLYTSEYLNELIWNRINDDNRRSYFVIYMNISEFKIVNDVYGMEYGDLVLKNIAERIKKDAGCSWLYGRIGGDSFGIMMPSEDFDRDIADKALSELVVGEGSKAHKIVMHMGIYETTRFDSDVAVMFDRAHLALNSIKGDYNVHIAFYDEKIRNGILKENMITSQLQEAIEQRHIMPYLQPIVDPNRNVVGAEALARWTHPTEGILSPAVFIPVLERNGLIADVDNHIWRCACEVLKRWQDQGIDMFISINISPKDFYFMDVPFELERLVEEYGIKAEKLRVELTETVMINNSDMRIKDIERLRDAGFIVEMDDFGSGFSSLNLLQDMPVDVLKIDMVFLRNTDDNPKAGKIIYNIIAMAKDLDLVPLTEGVESEYQYQQLVRMGCKLFQGNHFSKPVTIEEFEEEFI